MIHISNLEHTLQNGMFRSGHSEGYPGYVPIGNNTLISQRQVYDIPLAGCGQLGDYVPFYFGGHSPMLLQIKTGQGGVAQVPQRDIVFLFCRVDCFVQNNLAVVFTDGHAKDKLTNFYTQLSDLGQVDWDMVGQQYWHPNESDLDRQRRKQAEFLVRDHVPPNCIGLIAVYDGAAQASVTALVQSLNLQIPVKTDSTRKYFYP